jgi:LPXTG-motif cell wall-anchored protein
MSAMPRRALTSTAVALLLALAPTAGLADGGGAGDNQYQDPLASTTTPAKAKPKKKVATTAPSTATTTTPATTPASTTAPAATSGTSSSSASSRQLPRTGAPADLIGLAGAGLIAIGAVLRRRTSTQ